MLFRNATKTLKRASKAHFGLLVDHRELLIRDQHERDFIAKLSSPKAQQEFEKPLSADQIDYINLVYDAFFRKIEVEDKNLFAIRKMLNSANADDKGFAMCRLYPQTGL